MYADSSVTIRNASRRQLLPVAAAVLLAAVAGAAMLVWHGGGVRLLSVQTGSMVPAVSPGDAVLVRPVDVDALEPGDVISYHSPAGQGITITHRVVSVDRRYDRVVTQGDANESADQPVEGRAVIGRVERSFAGLGYGIDAVRSPAGLALGVYLPAAIMAAGEMRRMTEFFRPAYRHPVRRRHGCYNSDN